MNLSDVKEFERWFRERVGVTVAEAERLMDVRTVKAAYAAGLTRGTQETMMLMSRPLVVQVPLPIKQIGWRWHHPKAPVGCQFSPIFTDDKPGPERHAIAAAQNTSFGPTTVQPVYVLALP